MKEDMLSILRKINSELRKLVDQKNK